jgi:hypothetical protein
MSAQKWVRSSLRQLSKRLVAAGHRISPPTVGGLLRKLGYGRHANAKEVEGNPAHPDRNAQFEHIKAERQRFAEAGLPMISVDTKKKELIGNFKNAGQTWSQKPEAVNVHDFPRDALGRAVPYGIHDLLNNQGTVYVGSSADTPQFAADVIRRWWEANGRATFPDASELLILADAGGSNSYRSRVWKQQLQAQLCDRFGLAVTVCHYPTGCSKWNPIEHRLFSHISINWAGQPLRTWDIALACIRGTTTETGLKVQAFLQPGVYETGQKVPDAEMETLNLERHPVCPQWNYTLRPRLPPAPG